MSLYDLIRSEITAKQAAQLYGVKFTRGGRAFCPWHDDGKHPALAFYDNDNRCYCFVCHNGGDCIELTSQLLGISRYDAAKQLQKDFNLSQDYTCRKAPSTTAKAIKRNEHKERDEVYKRWSYLCDVVNECSAKLNKYTPDTIDDEFDTLLDIRSTCEMELDYIWDEVLPTYERVR